AVVFLQAEDGIRYRTVTGVQTCALPISQTEVTAEELQSEAELLKSKDLLTRVVLACNLQKESDGSFWSWGKNINEAADNDKNDRSEERRVGKERRGR